MRNRRGILDMAAGLLFLTAALVLTSYNIWEEHRADAAAQESVQRLQEVIPDTIEIPVDPDVPDASVELPYYMIDPNIEMPTIDIDGHEYIGYLDIPALELSLPVMSEWTYPLLKLSPCRYHGSAYTDDLIILAHNYDRHFGRLKDLVPGEIVTFTDADGNRFAYEVVQLEQLKGADVDGMLSGGWDLTLFTCTVGGKLRVVARCEKI